MLSVLIVDDNEYVAEAHKLLLTDEGFMAMIARDAEHALGFCGVHVFDLILCDMEIPPMPAGGVMRQLHVGAPRTPILALSGWTDPHAEAEALSAGASLYLAKPADAKRLMAAVQTLLAWTNASAPHVLAC